MNLSNWRRQLSQVCDEKLCIIQIELSIRSKGHVRFSLMFALWLSIYGIGCHCEFLGFLVLFNFSLSIFCKSDSILLYVYLMYIIIDSCNNCICFWTRIRQLILQRSISRGIFTTIIQWWFFPLFNFTLNSTKELETNFFLH